jgi:hypothetical protein
MENESLAGHWSEASRLPQYFTNAILLGAVAMNFSGDE